MMARLLQYRCGLQIYSKNYFINKSRILLCSNISNMTRHPKLLSKDSQKICRRMLYSLFKKPTVEELQLSDKIPSQFVLIYNNRMKNYLLYGHFTVCFCLAIFTILVSLKISSSNTKGDNIVENGSHFSNDQFIFLTSLILIIVMLQSLILRMPIRLYNNPQTNRYAFIYYGLLPSSKKTLFCGLTDIVKQEEKGLLPWNNSLFTIKERENAILIDDFFRTPSDLNIILGHQKPPNDQ